MYKCMSYVHVHRGGVTFICIHVRVTFRARLLCKNNGEGTPNVLENDTVTLLPLSISHRECLQYTKYVPCLPSSPCIAINTYMHQVPTAQCTCCETYILVWLKCANISKCSIGGPLPHVVLLQLHVYDIIHTTPILCCLCVGESMYHSL